LQKKNPAVSAARLKRKKSADGENQPVSGKVHVILEPFTFSETNSLTMAQDKSLIIVHVRLPNHWAVAAETLWATPRGDDLYTIENTPFFAYGINYKDVVRAKKIEQSPYPEVIEVVERSGNRTIRMMLKDTLETEKRSMILETLVGLATSFENADSKLYAVNIPVKADYLAVYNQIELWADKEEFLSFETTHERVPGSFDDEPSS
jgi:hypothetical protein